MFDLKEYEEIVLKSYNIPFDVVIDRQYRLDEQIASTITTRDLAKVENLFIMAELECREKVKKIYNKLLDDIKPLNNWKIIGKFIFILDENEKEVIKILFSKLNPCFKDGYYKPYIISKDNIKKILEPYNKTYLPLKRPLEGLMVQEDISFLHRFCDFPLSDIMRIKKIYTKVTLEYRKI